METRVYNQIEAAVVDVPSVSATLNQALESFQDAFDRLSAFNDRITGDGGQTKGPAVKLPNRQPLTHVASQLLSMSESFTYQVNSIINRIDP